MHIKKWFIRFVISIYIISFIYLTLNYFQLEKVLELSKLLLQNPFLLTVMFFLYGLSFVLRAISWKWYLKTKVSFNDCLNGLWYSLFINHLVPVKVGDLVRIGYLHSKQKHFTIGEITHSVIIMRLFDMLTLIVYSCIGLFFLTHSISLNKSVIFYAFLMVIGCFTIFIIYKYRPKLIKRHISLFLQGMGNRYSIIILIFIMFSWILEAVVIYTIAYLFDSRLSIMESIWINSMTVGGQVFQFLPGGVATYETTMAFALTYFQYHPEEAYHLALVTHIFKFVFSYIMGIYVVMKAPVKRKDLKRWIQQQKVKE